MNYAKTLFVLFFLFIQTLPFNEARAAGSDTIVQIKLIPENQSFARDLSARLGVQFQIKKGWHIYWLNPGESGLPPRITWRPVPGLEFQETHWPFPELFQTEQIQNFGYSETATAIQTFRVQKNFSGSHFDLHGDIEWLACQEICIPGKAEINQTFEVRPKGVVDIKAKSLLDEANAKLPRTFDYWYVKVLDRDDHLLLKIMPQKKLSPQGMDITFFPLTQGLPAVKIKGNRQGANLFKIKKEETFSKNEKILKGVAVASSTFDEDKKYFALQIDQTIQ